MGLRDWWNGHGWDGTKETPAERHFRTMQAEVAAWKAKWDARPREAVSLPPRMTEQELMHRWYGHQEPPTLREQIRQHPGEVERWQDRGREGRDQGVEW